MASPDRTPDLRRLQYFLAVADRLHFGRAAEDLGMAQPPLSQQIQKLEREIGYVLFDRGSAGRSGIRLTDAGTALVGPARRALAAAENAIESARRSGAQAAEQLRIAFVASSAPNVLAPIVRLFRHRHPGVELHLLEMTSSRQADALATSSIDLGLARDLDVSDSVGDSFVLHSERIVALLPCEHPRSRDSRIASSALANDGLIMFPASAGRSAYANFLGPLTRVGVAPRIVQQATEWSTIMSLVAAGLGVALVPESSARNAPGATAVVELDDPRATTSIHLCWNPEPDRTVLCAFRDIAKRWAAR